MSSAKRPLRNAPQETPERVWPLDVCIAALAGLVLFVSVTQLKFDDPRWLYNAWTYTVAVPLAALLLAVLSHSLVSRFVHRSIQVGLLFSLLVHLLLLVLAVNVIIFSRYFPEAFTGIRPDRSFQRKTLPEYLFQTDPRTVTTPDWEQPVEAETSSRVLPEEPRRLPLLEEAATKLEMPRPAEIEPPTINKQLTKRNVPAESAPMPTNAPAQMARRQFDVRSQPFDSSSPTAPDVPAEVQRTRGNVERRLSSEQRRVTPLTTSAAEPAPRQPQVAEISRPSIEGARVQDSELPTVGESGAQSERRQRSITRIQPAGSAPAPPSLSIARLDESASRVLQPTEVPLGRQGQTEGAQLTMGARAEIGLTASEPETSIAARASDTLAARSGVPEVTGGVAQRVPGRASRRNLGAGLEPAGTIRFQPSGSPAISDTAASSSAIDRLAQDSSADQPQRGSEQADQQPTSPGFASAGPTLDLNLEEGPSGLIDPKRLRRAEAGIAISDELPRIGALDWSRASRPKRDVGGPVTPVGTKIASVESFSRRVLRTQGGAAPPAAGLVAPAAEDAIERGLAYLANVQNKEGSWSLQGHGSDVVLRSDTAATGLCLLAFQGAGYTHRQHQYVDPVQRGLKFLLDHQQDNGDLYRPEDALSNRNVALYSHGIASLALCEAYGMTQDPELKQPAQNALNYIINTQHQQRGGWRYTPQISSDTSVTGWMMMALKSGQLAGLEVPEATYQGIERWLELAQSPDRPDRYRYNPFAPDTPTQRHGRVATPTMTAVGMLMRMYAGWRRDTPEMQSAADYLLQYPPQMGTTRLPQRDAYYWYYATQVMFHMGDRHWEEWNRHLSPMLLESQINHGPNSGSWDPIDPVPDRWSVHAGRLYVTTMNLLNLEVYYRHLPIYEETAQ